MRKQMISTGADKGNRCREQVLPVGGRYKKTNVTWKSRCRERTGEQHCDRCVDRQVWVKGIT